MKPVYRLDQLRKYQPRLQLKPLVDGGLMLVLATEEHTLARTLNRSEVRAMLVAIEEYYKHLETFTDGNDQK